MHRFSCCHYLLSNIVSAVFSQNDDSTIIFSECFVKYIILNIFRKINDNIFAFIDVYDIL